MSLEKKRKRSASRRNNNLGLSLKTINPKTYAQEQVFEAFFENHLLLHGFAGTGKTFLSLYLGLREVLEYETFRKVVIVRSAVQTRDLGFMPGDLNEKMSYYEIPYRDIVNELCGRGDAYDILKGRGVIEFMCTSFVRGLTIDQSVIVVDEIQNCTMGELDSVITRLGDNSKVVFCGDFRQSDLKTIGERSGITQFMSILKKLKGFEHIEFQINDIVRSPLIKQYIIEKSALGL